MIYRTIDRRNEVPRCSCGGGAYRILDLPMVSVDIPAYVSPSTGKLINSRQQRKEDLLKSNAYAWEPGIEKDIARKKEQEITESFKPISDAVDNTVRDMVACGKLES